MNRHYLIGISASLLLATFYLGVVTLAESWSHTLDQLADLWYWIVLLIAGFGVQVGLFSFIRHSQRKRRATTGSVAISGGVSAGSMVACCAHHLVDILPVLGLSGLALFLADYQVFFIVIGVVSNIIGIIIMLEIIQRHGLSDRLKNWSLNLNRVKKVAMISATLIIAATFFLTS